MPEQVLLHVPAERSRMIAGEPDVLVEIERAHVAPVELHAGQLAVQIERRPSGGQAQRRIGLRANQVGDQVGGDLRGLFGGGLDDDFHTYIAFSCAASLAATSSLNLSTRRST